MRKMDDKRISDVQDQPKACINLNDNYMDDSFKSLTHLGQSIKKDLNSTTRTDKQYSLAKNDDPTVWVYTKTIGKKY